jgi:NDP-sugar pyrophosphorylase family protein
MLMSSEQRSPAFSKPQDSRRATLFARAILSFKRSAATSKVSRSRIWFSQRRKETKRATDRLTTMKALILAAGLGTRLWPLTEDRTKAAIPFLNRPLIAYSVEYLAANGIRDIIVNLHHQPDSIRHALGDGSNFGVKISYSFEPEILGTSGALNPIRESLLDDDFLVINGKIITNIDLVQAIEEHRKQDAIATLVLRENRALEHFSIVEVDERGWITRFAGFPEVAQSQAASAEPSGNPVTVAPATTEPAPLMFTGIQVLSPRVFQYIPRRGFSHSTVDVYPQAIAAGEAVIGHLSTRDWYEMSTLSRYLEANLRLMNPPLGDHAGSPPISVVAGADCIIDDDATLQQAVLWDNVTVEAGARVRDCVLGERVLIPANAIIEQAVVVRRELVRNIERGEVVGENLIVPID